MDTLLLVVIALLLIVFIWSIAAFRHMLYHRLEYMAKKHAAEWNGMAESQYQIHTTLLEIKDVLAARPSEDQSP